MAYLGREAAKAPLVSSDIPDDSITAAKIVDSTIAAGDLAANSVDSSELVDGSIDTSHIADNQVTLAKMAGGTDGQIITYDASGDPVAVGPGTDGQVLTSTGAGSPPAFEATASSGINSPWDHIGSFSSTSDITNGNIKFANVFDTYHTMYRLIIPYMGATPDNNNIYLSFCNTTGSKTISAPSWSTSDVNTTSNYRGFFVLEGSDNGVYGIDYTVGVIDAAEFTIWPNVEATVRHQNEGIRGYVDFWMPQRANIWDYGTDASVTSDLGSTAGYSGGYSFHLYGYDNLSGTEAAYCRGYLYVNQNLANDAVTGFVIYNELRNTIYAETTMHLLGLKLDLSTS